MKHTKETTVYMTKLYCINELTRICTAFGFTVGPNEGQYDLQELRTGAAVSYRLVRYGQKGITFPAGADFSDPRHLAPKLLLWEQSLTQARKEGERDAERSASYTNGSAVKDPNAKRKLWIDGGFREVAARLVALEEWKDEMERVGLGLHEAEKGAV